MTGTSIRHCGASEVVHIQSVQSTTGSPPSSALVGLYPYIAGLELKNLVPGQVKEQS